MKRICFSIAVIFCAIDLSAQFINDNVLYKTVDPSQLCSALQSNPEYLLLDVRSAPEYGDSSLTGNYNLGHLKGAKNISINELGRRISEISVYKDKPIFVYCSHSQRSRRASKMLADSGFTKVYNVNGGMTALYYTDALKTSCLSSFLETANGYKIISANQVCDLMRSYANTAFILDVRPDSAFRHITNDAKFNSFGSITGAINIPLTTLESRLREIPVDANVIVTDIYGDAASDAARLLVKHGYKNVSVLIEGIDRIVTSDEQLIPCKKSIYRSAADFAILTSTEFGKRVQESTALTLLDVRSREEVSNTHKDYWRNTGHVKNSINIPATELERSTAALGTDKNREIIVYGFSSGPEVYAAANRLRRDGFKNVMLLSGGIFNLRWTAGNVKDQGYLADWVIEVPEANR